METSVDAFLGGRFKLEQPCGGQRAAIDALLLAAIVPCAIESAGPVLDAGCGSAPIALSLATRFAHLHITGIERQEEIATLARRNASINEVEERVNIICADLTKPLGELADHGLRAGSFAHVVANPPFYRVDRSRSNKDDSKSAAHQLQQGDLAHWIRFLTAMAGVKASLSLIHRPENLQELLELLQGRFGALKIAPVYSNPKSAAIRVLIQGIKGSRAPLSLLPGFTLCNEDGQYSKDAQAVLREGTTLTL